MSVPRVSVVVPFLDTPPAFLRAAVDSVLQQSGIACELVLVDDGSGRPARDEARRIASAHPTVRLVDAPEPRPARASAARNAGADVAAGEFYVFLDSDDTLLPGRLAAHVQALDSCPEADLSFGSTEYWHSWAGTPSAADHVPEITVKAGLCAPPDMAVRIVRGTSAVPCVHAVTVRAEAFHAVGGFEPEWGRLYEDQVYLVKLFSRYPAWYLPKPLERYRIHDASVTHVATGKEHRLARLQFLDWVETTADALPDERDRGALQGAVRYDRWRIRHPRLAAAHRRLRKAIGRSRPRRQEELS